MPLAEGAEEAFEALTSVAVALAEAPVWRLGDEALVEQVPWARAGSP